MDVFFPAGEPDLPVWARAGDGRAGGVAPAHVYRHSGLGGHPEERLRQMRVIAQRLREAACG